MVDPGEIASAIIVAFIGVITVGATWAALYGGDVAAVTSIASALAVPVVVLALFVFGIVAVFNVIQDAGGR